MTPSKLQKFMTKHGLTAVDVSSRTHVSVRTVERYLNGETDNPHALVLDAFARLMSEESGQNE